MDKPLGMDVSQREMAELMKVALSKLQHYLFDKERNPLIPMSNKAKKHLSQGISKAEKHKHEFALEGDSNLERVFDQLIQRFDAGQDLRHPGYMSYVDGGGIFYGAIADFVASTINRYTAYADFAPKLVAIEVSVLRWLCDVIGYKNPSSFGFFTTGGSAANFTSVVLARNEKLKSNWDYPKGIIYTCDQTHHSLIKGCRIAGFPRGNVRSIVSNSDFTMNMEELERQIEADKAQGLIPFLIVGTSGTTNTGAIDNIATLRRIADANNMWLHVDGAYGALFALAPSAQPLLNGPAYSYFDVALADSVTLDPHKSFFLPFGTGCLLVKDREVLYRMFRVHDEEQPYMHAGHDFSEDLVDFADMTPEQTREFRALRIWLPLKILGIKTFQNCLQEKYDLAHYLHTELVKLPPIKRFGKEWSIEVVSPTVLSVVCFALIQLGAKSPEWSEENELTEILIEKINKAEHVYLVKTILKGRTAVRVCVLNYRTHKEHVNGLIEDVRKAMFKLSYGKDRN